MNTPLMTSNPPGQFPVSIKAVLLTEPGEVVLLRNDRGEWELPGGRLEVDESPEQCLVREIEEELGIAAEVHSILDSYLFEVIRGRQVLIVTYACQTVGVFEPVVSDEHLGWACFRPDELPDALPVGYQASIRRAIQIRLLHR